MRRVSFLALVATMLFLLSGCSLFFRSACDKALPTITVAQSYEADARAKLEQAKAFVAHMPESPLRAELVAAIAECDRALGIVDASLVGASDACKATDALDVFAAFIKAWSVLEPLLAKSKMAAGPGVSASSPVGAPLIVLKARGAR